MALSLKLDFLFNSSGLGLTFKTGLNYNNPATGGYFNQYCALKAVAKIMVCGFVNLKKFE